MLLKDMEILRWFKKLVWIMQFGSLQLHWGSVQQPLEQSYMLDVLSSFGGSWKKLLLKKDACIGDFELLKEKERSTVWK